MLNQLRAKALKIGANAVIATDIDYGEVGSLKGMLMVCAAGTAIKLENTNILGSKQTIVDEIVTSKLELDLIIKILKMNDISFIDSYNRYKGSY